MKVDRDLRYNRIMKEFLAYLGFAAFLLHQMGAF